MRRNILVIMLITLMLIPIIPSTTKSDMNEKPVLVEQSITQDALHENLTRSMTDIMGANVEIWSSDQSFDGYNLFVLRKKNVDVQGYNQTLLMTDMQGNVLLEENVVEGVFELADVNIEMINSTTLLMGYKGTAAIWNLETDVRRLLGFWGHHEYEYNNNDNTIFTHKYNSVTINGDPYLMDEIREYDLNGDIVWSLDVSSFISHEWLCPYGDRFMNQPDVTHGNTLFYDDDEDMLYYHPRNTNTFFKINHSTKEVIWGLGEYGDFTLIDRYGRIAHSLFYHGHALEKVDDNTFIIYDNDLHNQSDQFNHRSRMIEITINEDTMTAYESWTWTGGDDYWCHFWGDADRLPNGNRLGTFGAPTHAAGDYGPRVVEVNDAGDIVWEMNFLAEEQYKWGIYRCERVRFEPSLISPTDTVALFNEDIELTWQALYNFRSKMSMNGSFNVYVNGSHVESGDIIYDRFWRPVDVVTSIGQWPPGLYNVTLEAFDEGGHSTSDSIFIEVMPIYIERQGSTHLEEGQDEYLITWSGGTVSPLDCIILVDSIEKTSFTWNGEDIELDLGTIETGEHEVILTLMNGSVEVYRDAFTLKICPNAYPVLSASPTFKSFAYGREHPLVWTVNECAPAFWELYLDDVLILNETWSVGETEIQWTPTDVDIGGHNVTLVLVDMANHRVKDTAILFITSPSPPIILSSPDVGPVLWGTPDVSFTWDVVGGSHWKALKNGITLYGGPVTDTEIGFVISDWSGELWSVGKNVITLKVYDPLGVGTDRIIVNVTQDPGDAYADSIVTSLSTWYSSGENALGMPDGESASIFEDYGPGYMTLDMGQNEDVIDGAGDDFTIHASGGRYALSVKTTLADNPLPIGVFNGSQSFDLDSLGIASARYIRLEYFSGDSVSLDSIEALNYNTPPSDTINPLISDEADVVLPPTETSITLEWNGSDDNPLSYQVLLNGTVNEFGAWSGGVVSYTFVPSKIGVWNVTMVFSDAFGNTVSDRVYVQVSVVYTDSLDVTVILLFSGVGIAAVLLIGSILYRRRLAGTQ